MGWSSSLHITSWMVMAASSSSQSLARKDPILIVVGADLKDFARAAGHVTFADIDRRDPTLGFIEYGSARDAEDAVRKLDGTDLVGAVVTVTADGPPPPRDGGRGGDRGGDDGYSRRSTRDAYDDRERDRRPRSPSPRRSRSPPRRRSPTPERDTRERSRSRSPRRD
ncbi:hypothetical protein BMF94_1083 [Rhodotorula taiwanensis]|uniref:RRM domain-containing protein n=1 Tax=Rhodotorula taiwanensis TaxID=741276 RepID=A0A2S5BGW0_9BASI|nr:hypothetical protein BMF94_1083 [Rhodotorula taiwanensis]